MFVQLTEVDGRPSHPTCFWVDAVALYDGLTAIQHAAVATSRSECVASIIVRGRFVSYFLALDHQDFPDLTSSWGWTLVGMEESDIHVQWVSA